MSKFKKTLCPVDMSENGLAAVQLASTIAKENDSTLVFMYVAPQWLPEEAMFGSEYISSVVEEDKKKFEELRPTDPNIKFEHVFKHGNAGPEIVRESKTCDMIVLSTHGYGAVMRLLMGSVTQYTMRHATCPVVVFKNAAIKNDEQQEEDVDVATRSTPSN